MLGFGEMTDTEQKVRQFYDNFGWVKSEGQSGEDKSFRQFSRHYYAYHARVDARTKALFANLRGYLLIAGCGDLPENHIEVARQFSKVCCLDISEQAVLIAQAKLGDKAECVLGSILELSKPSNSFDAVFSAHVVYHIDKELQAGAIRELIRVTRPGGKLVLIYRNPNSAAERIVKRMFRVPLLWRLADRGGGTGKRTLPYFHAHTLDWWRQFSDECAVNFVPWDVLSSYQEKALLIKGAIAWAFYRICGSLEVVVPRWAVRHWSYPVIVLTKKTQPERSARQ